MQGRIQHVIITGGCTVILAHAQVVGGGAVRTLVRTLQRELLGRCLPCGGALNLHNHLGWQHDLQVSAFWPSRGSGLRAILASLRPYETGGCNPLNPLPGSAPAMMHQMMCAVTLSNLVHPWHVSSASPIHVHSIHAVSRIQFRKFTM